MDRPASWPRDGEWRRAIAIASILIASAMIQGICDVLATSGVGERGVVWMWAVDAGIALIGIGALARGVDSVDRRRLGVVLLSLFAVSYLFVWTRTLTSHHPAFWWGVLGVVDTLQSNLVVLLAWALARDLFNELEAIRLFGLLGGVAYIGTLTGTGLAGFVAKRTLLGFAATDFMLPLCAALALLTAVLVAWLLPPHLVHFDPNHLEGAQTKPPPEDETAGATLHALVDVATLRYLWREPTLRWLSALQIGNAASWTMMSLAVLFALRSTGSEHGDLQQAYSNVRIMGPLAHATVQAAVSGYLLRRLGYGRLFLLTPLVLLGNLILLGVAPGLMAAWTASLLIQFAFGAEGAAAHALLVRAPAHIRGRVGTFIMGTLPQLGYLIGCGLLFATRWFTDALDWSDGAAMRFTIVFAVGAAIINVTAGGRLRQAFAASTEIA